MPDVDHVRDLTVASVSAGAVEEFAKRYHYSRTGRNAMWRWGLFSRVYGLVGVVAYNLPTRSVCTSVFGPENGHDHVWHMGRLILTDECPRNSESRLIGASLRGIREHFPHVWAVVTYADQTQGHIGYVYQATNALYTGEGSTHTSYVDATGTRRSDYLDGRHVGKARAHALGWSINPDRASKHRYVYILGSSRQRRDRRELLRWPVLPYPKSEVAVNA